MIFLLAPILFIFIGNYTNILASRNLIHEKSVVCLFRENMVEVENFFLSYPYSLTYIVHERDDIMKNPGFYVQYYNFI